MVRQYVKFVCPARFGPVVVKACLFRHKLLGHCATRFLRWNRIMVKIRCTTFEINLPSVNITINKYIQ